jgi:hypothetical protein
MEQPFMPGEQLLLINPRRRKRAKNSRRRKHRARSRNSRRRTHRAAGGYRIRRRRIKNPRSHRRHRRSKNPVSRRYHRRRHRNPLSMSGIKGAIVPAALGAVGGVAVDYIYNFLSPNLPSSITGMTIGPPLIKIAGAFGVGMIGEKVLGPDKGKAVLAGALAIQIYNLIAGLIGGTPGMAGLGAYMRNGVSGLGSPNPAVYLQKPMGRMGRVGRVGAYMQPLSGLPFAGLGSLGSSVNSEDMFG